MSKQPEDTPKPADFLLKEADAVRAEIVYKMELAHRVALTILVAPSLVLPAMAKLSEQIAGTGQNPGLGPRTALFDLVLAAVAFSLPQLLLWADLFCHAQVNGIRRAGDWLKNLEQSLGLGSTRNGWSGWETWISAGQRRRWDDDLYRWLREGLVFLYYVAASGMASFLVGDVLRQFGVPSLLGLAADTGKALAYGAPALYFASIYLGIAGIRFATTYAGESASNGQFACVEPAVLNAARQAYRAPAGVLRFPYIAPSSAPAAATSADPLRMLGESSRVLGLYHELYDWDGIFCGAALLHESAPLNQVLEGVIRNFLAAQRADGFVPKSLTHDNQALDPHELCKPLLAQGALAVSHASGGQHWLDDATFNALVAFVEHWLRERRGPSGMFKWRSALESGVDNNAALVHFPPLSIEAVDATCFVARECAALALLAEKRANGAIVQRMRRCALDAQHALLTRSWDEDARIFWNRHVDSGLPVKLMSWTGLMPLWGGFMPRRTRIQLVRRQLRPGGPFLTTHGIMTLARGEAAFNNGRRTYIWEHTTQTRKEVSNWQGPTWVLPNALLADALAAAGNIPLAQLLCRGTLTLLARDLAESGTMHECYDADSGAPLWAPGFLSWNALVLGMLRWLQGRSPTILRPGLSTLSVPLS